MLWLSCKKNKIAHRDIKPQNVLVFNDNLYKIADFGEAKVLKSSKQQNTLRGTELYMSPLLFNGLKVNRNDVNHNPYKSDVFSLSFCLIYAACLSYNPLYDLRKIFDTKTVNFILVRYLNGKYSGLFINLLSKMLEINEEARLDFIDLESHINITFK